jgi:hypothetical protein
VAGVLGFEREGVGERHVFAAAIKAQHLRDRAGRGDLSGELCGLGEQVVVRHDVVHQADAQRLVGGDEVAGDRHLRRLADPDRPRQQRGEAPRGDHTQSGMGVGEARSFRRDDQGGAQRDLEPAGDASTVHRADHRLAHGAQRAPGIVRELLLVPIGGSHTNL